MDGNPREKNQPGCLGNSEKKWDAKGPNRNSTIKKEKSEIPDETSMVAQRAV